MPRPSKPSSALPEQVSFELDATDPTNPPKARIARAWEIILIALDDMDPPDQVLAMIEIERRAKARGLEKLASMERTARAVQKRLREIKGEA